MANLQLAVLAHILPALVGSSHPRLGVVGVEVRMGVSFQLRCGGYSFEWNGAGWENQMTVDLSGRASESGQPVLALPISKGFVPQL